MYRKINVVIPSLLVVLQAVICITYADNLMGGNFLKLKPSEIAK